MKQVPTLSVSPWQMLKGTSWRLRVRLLWSALRFGLNPERTEELFKISALFMEPDSPAAVTIRDFTAQLLAMPGMREICAERYLPPRPVIADLRRLPEGTLGRAFAEHMLRFGLEVEFFPAIEAVDDVTYINLRARQIHDIAHVVTGFSPSQADELGLQAFEAGQLNTPLSAGIIGGGLVRASLLAPWQQHEFLEAIARGYAMGKAARIPMLAFRFEDNWATPLSEVRRQLGLEMLASA